MVVLEAVLAAGVPVLAQVLRVDPSLQLHAHRQQERKKYDTGSAPLLRQRLGNGSKRLFGDFRS